MFRGLPIISSFCTHALSKTVLLTVWANVVSSKPDFLTSYHNPHLPRYMSSFNMHQWVLLCMTQQCMLMQDEVMLSLSNTVVLTTSNSTARP